MDASDLLNIISDNNVKSSVFALGTIPSSYSSGRPTVQFDGEASASTRKYPYASSYIPAAGHRVLLARVNNCMVVLCRII